MARWPQVADYKEAIQNPSTCFAEADLQAGETAMNVSRGSPILSEGNFAVVFKVHCRATNDTWAIKCFHRKVDDLQIRYKAISEHLLKHQEKLPFTVECKYLEKGIKIRGEWFPILKMRWVDGNTFNEFVQPRLNNPGLLKKVADLLVKMEKCLRSARMAHGDLQHGNILIVAKTEKTASIKLVDYDGMFVPALASNGPSETGHPNFQHKERLAKNLYNDKIDRFPLLLMYSALHFLAAEGEALWSAGDNGDNLLFRESDFANPSDSELLHRLWYGSNGSLKVLAGKLILASQGPLEQVPLLEEFVGTEKKIELTSAESDRVDQILGAAKKIEPTVPRPAPTFDFVKEETPSEALSPSGPSAPVPKRIPTPPPSPISSAWSRHKPVAPWPGTPSSPNSTGPGAPGPVPAARSRQVLAKLIPAAIIILVIIVGIVFVVAGSDPTKMKHIPANPHARNLNPQQERIPTGKKKEAVKDARVGQESSAPKSEDVGGKDERPFLTARIDQLTLNRYLWTKPFPAVPFYTDGRCILTCGRVGGQPEDVKLWDAVTGREIRTLKRPTETFNRAAISQDRKRIALGVSTANGGPVMVWDAETGQPTVSLKTHDAVAMAFSPDGMWIATGGGNPQGLVGELKVWDTETGREARAFQFQLFFPRVVAFSPGGKHLLGTNGTTVKVWDALTGKEIIALNGHREMIWCMAISLDGNRIASGGGNKSNELKVWDPQTGLHFSLEGHRGIIYSVAFSPDGKRLVTGSADKTVKVWDLQTQQETHTFPNRSSWFDSVAFSPDGLRVVSVSMESSSAKAWNVQTGQEITVP